MPKVKNVSEEEILNMLRILPDNKKEEAMDFLEFLSQKWKKTKRHDPARAVSAIEKTWGSVRLDKKTLQFIAENKEIEYDI